MSNSCAVSAARTTQPFRILWLNLQTSGRATP
jgi:hypothetical protein